MAQIRWLIVVILYFGVSSKLFSQDINNLRTSLEAKNLHDTLKYHTYYQLALLYKNKNGQIDSTLYYIDKALEISSKNKSDRAKAQLLKGETYLYSGWGFSSWWLAFENTLEAAKTFNQLKDKINFSKAINTLAITYISRRDNQSHFTEKQIFYSVLADEILINPNYQFQKQFTADTTDTPATKQSLLQALQFFKKVLIYYNQKGNYQQVMYQNQKIAECYIELGNINLFEAYNLKALQIAQQIRDYHFTSVILLGLSHYFHLYKNTKKQKKYAEAGILLAKKHLYVIKEAQFCDQLYYYYKEKSNYKYALKYKERNISILDSLTLLGEKEKNVLIKQKNDAQKLQFETTQKLIKEQNTQNVMLVILIAFIFLGGVFLWNIISLRKSNLKLLSKNKEIEKARLMGQAIERKRVAADLHNNIGTMLSAIHWNMETLVNKESLKPQELLIYDNVLNMLDKTHNEIRLLSHNLMPEDLEQLGIARTLEKLIKNLNKRGKTQFQLFIELNQPLDKYIEFEIYSICLENINNIMRHAEAPTAYIKIYQTYQFINLNLKDDGKGFNASNIRGFGLKNIYSRVEAMKGTIFIDSIEGYGTEIKIKIPMEKLTVSEA